VHRGYKRTANLGALDAAVDALLARARWLSLGGYEGVCRRVDHAFDAVVAALTARAAQLGLTTRPGPHELAAARTEGWIAVPTTGLDELAP
jgi:hypothetical protein